MITKRQGEILEATKKIFAKKGYYGTTMNAIAEEVGIRKASLYAHFNHKDAIFYFLFDEILEEHKKALELIFNQMKGHTAKKQLYIFLKEYVDYCYNNETLALWNHFYYYPPESMESWIRSATHKSEKIIKDNIIKVIKLGQEEKSIRQYDISILYQLYYNMYLGFVLSAPEYESMDMRHIIKDSFLLYWDAVKPGVRHPF